MFLQGLNPVNETYSTIKLERMVVRNLNFDRDSLIFGTGDFLSEMNIDTSLSNSEFTNIQFNKLGKFFHI